MSNVVYILGAGFSAPLGVPVVRDFLFRAKDQFAANPARFTAFSDVFSAIDEISRAKNYLTLDLFNIEEILSIIDMRGKTQGHLEIGGFQDFIRDVIEHHTPPPRPSEDEFQPGGQGVQFILGGGVWSGYVAFAASLINLTLKANVTDSRLRYENILRSIRPEGAHNYKIISFNYDQVLEHALSFLNTNFLSESPDGVLPNLRVAKLHGDVSGEIVPPTWRKELPHSVQRAWEDANLWLREANEIRILGYSLPPTDVHFKYLLASAMVGSPNLQQIDVMCLDPDDSVARRFESLIVFPRFRFARRDVQDFLHGCAGVGCALSPFSTDFTRMEQSHTIVMSGGHT